MNIMFHVDKVEQRRNVYYVQIDILNMNPNWDAPIWVISTCSRICIMGFHRDFAKNKRMLRKYTRFLDSDYTKILFYCHVWPFLRYLTNKLPV